MIKFYLLMMNYFYVRIDEGKMKMKNKNCRFYLDLISDYLIAMIVMNK